MKISAVKWIVGLSIFCLGLLATSISYAKSNRPVICNNKYALCSAAPCIKIPGVKGKVLCHCSIWNGKNAGYSTCRQRRMKTGKYKQQHILSTFSFGGFHYKTITCPASSPWASCLDQPCIIDANHPRRAFCTCNIKYNTAFVTFAGECNLKNCSKSIWSGASEAGNATLVKALSKGMGLKKIPNRSCTP